MSKGFGDSSDIVCNGCSNEWPGAHGPDCPVKPQERAASEGAASRIERGHHSSLHADALTRRDDRVRAEVRRECDEAYAHIESLRAEHARALVEAREAGRYEGKDEQARIGAAEVREIRADIARREREAGARVLTRCADKAEEGWALTDDGMCIFDENGYGFAGDICQWLLREAAALRAATGEGET